MSTHRVTVGRVRNVYLVPREHCAPAEVWAKLDRVARYALPAAVQRALGPAIEPGDERVWLIRRLDFGLALNPDADDAPLAEAWAAVLAAVLAGLRAAGPDDENVVIFPSREAFLARYLTDRATRRAGGRWWYAEYDSLASLPAGTAIREALARDPPRAAAVLRYLAAERSLESVLGVLTPQDAHVVWRLLAPVVEPAPVSAAVIASLLAAWPRAALRPVGGYASPSNAIRWFVAVPPGRATTEELHRGVELLLAAADATVAPSTDNASENPLTPAQEETLRLLVSDGRVRHQSGGAEPRVIASPFAGLFLAWAAFASSGLAGLCRHGAFRYLVAVKLVGRPRVVEAWEDAAVLLAAGLDRPPGAQEWHDFVHSGERAALARDLVQWFVRCGLGGDGVAVERSGDVLLFRDPRTDAWLHAVRVPAESEVSAAMREGVAFIEQATGQACTTAAEAQPSRHASTNLAHLTLAGAGLPPGLDPETDLLGTLVARAALRRFAGRLPGFGAVSADHLYRNFLAGPGEIRIGGGEVAVRLDPPPLHVVLRLAGLDDETFTLPDGKRTRVALNPD
jgi:hypothetical protein